MKIRTLVLTGFGINCERETADAFERAGSRPEIHHLNDVIAEPALLTDSHILAIPGGFSFGDDVASGRILANRMRFRLEAPLRQFVDDGKLAIGICNGFQVMVKMGLLPLCDREFRQEVTVTHNDSNRFENRWVHLAVAPETPCVWLRGIEQLEAPIRHGEGKFVPRDTALLERLRENGQLALRYVQADGTAADGKFPANPNGSVDDVAGICDPSGRIFGLMPHPEAFLDGTNHPTWTRDGLVSEGQGLTLFRNAVAYAKETLVSLEQVGRA